MRQGAADTKSKPVNDDESPQTAAEIRALAEQAEAEAAEAEALAAAARARSRALQLRRQAERVEAQSQEAAPKQVAAQGPATAQTKVAKAAEVESEQDRPAAKRESVERDEISDEAEAAEGEGPADAETETAETADVAQPARRWRRLRRPKWSTIAACLAIVISLAALAGSGYMIKEHRDAALRRQRAAEFAAAARQGVVTMTSLDFHDAKAGVQRILDNATGTFKDEFIKTSDDFIKTVEESKVVSQGTVQATAVDLDTMTKDSAVVLVASTQEVTNAAGAKQDPRTYRLIVTVARDGGQLKMSKIEFVP